MKKLWEHQKYAVKKYKDKPFFGLLFPTGTGKSLTATHIAEEKKRPVLIIAPNALCKQWADELTEKGKDRITEKNWDVVVCTSKTKNTKKFKKDFKKLCEDVSC